MEKRNIPVATVCTDEFYPLGRSEAECLGMPGLPITRIPHPMADRSPDEVSVIAAEACEDIIRILTTDAGRLELAVKAKTIHVGKISGLKHKTLFGDAFRVSETGDTLKAPASLGAVNRLFYRRGWTDGLPIVPPTESRVARMLSHTGWHPQTEIGAVAPQGGIATAGKIAANAVMAGCLPEHLPVVIAATRAMVQAPVNLYTLQTTTHPCAVLTLINGPLRRELEFNCGYNALGQGNLSNATVGRAVRLVLINVGGTAPGLLDRATLGTPAKYSYCFAENEEDSPWEPLQVEKGFPASVSTVTVIGAEAPHNVNDHGGTTGEEILMTVSGVLATPGSNNLYLRGQPLVVLGTEHAAIIARDGFSKAAVKEFLFQKARVPVASIARGNMDRFRKNHPERFSDLGPEGRIPVVDRPADLLVVVAGGRGRHSLVIPTFGEHCRAATVVITDSAGNPIRSSDPES